MAFDTFIRNFFEAGGTGILAGDGKLSCGWEKILEARDDFKIWKTIHATLDYQFITDPAFNRDRGPVSVFGAAALGILSRPGRLHNVAELGAKNFGRAKSAVGRNCWAKRR